MELEFWEIESGEGEKISHRSNHKIGVSDKFSSKLGGFRAVDTSNRLEKISSFLNNIVRDNNQLVMGAVIDTRKTEKLVTQLKANFSSDEGLVGFSTSGSSGEPKIVIHDSKKLLLAAAKIVERYPLIQGRRFHHLFPENYMAGLLNNILVPSVAESSVFLDEVFNFSTPFTIHSSAKKAGTSGAWLSPSMISSIATGTGSALSELWSFAFSATGPLHSDTREQFHLAMGMELLNTYGTTEQLFIASETEAIPEVTCGLPFPDVSLKQKNHSGNNSLLVLSNTTAKAVLNWSQKKDNYELQFIEQGDYLDTKDVVEMNTAGVKILGRTDNIVVLGGENISLEKIEEISKELAFVKDCCAFAKFGGTTGDISLICEGQIEETEKSQLREHLVLKLGRSAPRTILVGEIPRTFSGKPDRQKLASGS